VAEIAATFLNISSRPFTTTRNNQQRFTMDKREILLQKLLAEQAELIAELKAQSVEKEYKARNEPKSEVVKAKTGQAVFGLDLDPPGTLDASSFMKKIREAGMRSFTKDTPNGKVTVRKFVVSDERSDMIKAIAGYVGFDTLGNFGEQELAARSQAIRELGISKTNGPSRQEQRQALRALPAKDPAGVCNPHAKREAHILAAENMVAELAIDYEKEGQMEHAELERDRLASVRKQVEVIRSGGHYFNPSTGK